MAEFIDDVSYWFELLRSMDANTRLVFDTACEQGGYLASGFAVGIAEENPALFSIEKVALVDYVVTGQVYYKEERASARNEARAIWLSCGRRVPEQLADFSLRLQNNIHKYR